MFCPECRIEYREGFTVCVDCGVALVAKLPPEPAEESSPECADFEEVLGFMDEAVLQSLSPCWMKKGLTTTFRVNSKSPGIPTEGLWFEGIRQKGQGRFWKIWSQTRKNPTQ